MIEMRRAGQLDLTKLLQFEQDVQQRHRVRATRKRAQDAASIVQQPIPPDRPENRIEQLHPVGMMKWWRCRDLNPGPCGYEPHALTS